MPAAGSIDWIRSRVWDRPVRIFHWTLTVLIALAWWTADHGQMQVHKAIGCTIAALLIFRIWWGIFGTSTARFASFVKGPIAVARYARNLIRRNNGDEAVVGHNPMGGWSVLALLMILALQVFLGSFSVDVDGEASGPLADRISFDLGRVAAHWHHLVFNVILTLIALHLAAIAFYAFVKRSNLVTPMVTGRKQTQTQPEDLQPVAPWRFWLGALLAAACGLFLSRGLR